MDEGLGPDGRLVQGSELEGLLKDAAGFEGMSKLGKVAWLEELNKKIAEGVSYLMVIGEIENPESEADSVDGTDGSAPLVDGSTPSVDGSPTDGNGGGDSDIDAQPLTTSTTPTLTPE